MQAFTPRETGLQAAGCPDLHLRTAPRRAVAKQAAYGTRATTCTMWFVAALALALAGCSTPTPKPHLQASSTFRVFIPTGATGYKPQPNQFIVIGPPLVQPPPTYPAALIAERLPPQEVCLALAIDENGNAHGSDPLYSVDGCPAPGVVPAPFMASAQATVTRWRFFPTHLCTFPKGVDVSKEGDNCIAEGAKVQRLPIKLAFAFTFTVEAGTPRVTARRMELAPTNPRPGPGSR